MLLTFIESTLGIYLRDKKDLKYKVSIQSLNS